MLSANFRTSHSATTLIVYSIRDFVRVTLYVLKQTAYLAPNIAFQVRSAPVCKCVFIQCKTLKFMNKMFAALCTG